VTGRERQRQRKTETEIAWLEVDDWPLASL